MMVIFLTISLYVDDYLIAGTMISPPRSLWTSSFIKQFIDTSSDGDFDDDTDILVVAESLFNEHNNAQLPEGVRAFPSIQFGP
jgi:hypothetical protein